MVFAALVPATVVKETFRSHDRWRSVIEGTSRKSVLRSTHQPSSSQASPPTSLSSVPDVQRATWGAELSLKRKHKWTRDSPQAIREGWGALMTICTSVILSSELSEGRSSSQMAPVCRAASAYVLGSLCHVAYRWAPSEWNGADLPSRDRHLHQWRHQSFPNIQADLQPRHGQCRQPPSGTGDRSGIPCWQRKTRQSRPSVCGPTEQKSLSRSFQCWARCDTSTKT